MPVVALNAAVLIEKTICGNVVCAATASSAE